MPWFAITTKDKENSQELRRQTRPAHLAYLAPYLDRILVAGPFLDEDDNSTGGLVIIDLPDLETARDFAHNDPYAGAGLFEQVEVRPWRKVILE